jgi:hypothetical protein
VDNLEVERASDPESEGRNTSPETTPAQRLPAKR